MFVPCLACSILEDIESAKMVTSKGVIQGYFGAASVDKKHQVIVGSKAYGQGHATDLFLPDYYGRTRSGKKRLFRPSDLIFADDLSHAICPAGKRLYRIGSCAKTKDYLSYRFK